MCRVPVFEVVLSYFSTLAGAYYSVVSVSNISLMVVVSIC